MKDLRKQYEKETGKKWYTKVCFFKNDTCSYPSEGRKVSENYVRWLEEKIQKDESCK